MKSIFLIVAVWASALVFSMVSAQEQTIVRVDPALDRLIDPDAKLVLITDMGADGSVEGPTWRPDPKAPDGGYFLFSSRVPREIAQWSLNTDFATAYDLLSLLPDMEMDKSSSSGIALDPEGRLVICSAATHSVVRIEKDGTTTTLAHLVNGSPLDRPNDLIINSNGDIYFTDNSRDVTGRAPPAVYLIKEGRMTPIITDLVRPNGITLSPDGNVLYVNDSGPRAVYSYDILPDGTVTNGWLLMDMGSQLQLEGTADGLKTDSLGNIYTTGPGGLWIISPEGKLLGRIRTPERLTNLAFGGPDGRMLFMTGHEMLFYMQVKVPGV